MKNTPIKSIQEIAELKNNPIKYYSKNITKATKTHDGTSLGGKIGKALDNATKELKKSLYKKSMCFDEKGNMIQTGSVGDDGSGILENDPHAKNVHFIEKYGLSRGRDQYNGQYKVKAYNFETGKYDLVDENYVPIKESGAIISGFMKWQRPGWNNDGAKPDIPFDGVYDREIGYMYVPTQAVNRLALKNVDGEYVYRSVSLVSPNGTRVTYVRNDDFNGTPEDMKKLEKSTFDSAVKYNNDFEKQVKVARDQPYLDENGKLDPSKIPDSYKGHELYRPSDRYRYVDDRGRETVLKENGTWEQNIDRSENGEFAKNNIKVRVSRTHTDNSTRFDSYGPYEWEEHDTHSTGLYKINGQDTGIVENKPDKQTIETKKTGVANYAHPDDEFASRRYDKGRRTYLLYRRGL